MNAMIQDGAIIAFEDVDSDNKVIIACENGVIQVVESPERPFATILVEDELYVGIEDPNGLLFMLDLDNWTGAYE